MDSETLTAVAILLGNRLKIPSTKYSQDTYGELYKGLRKGELRDKMTHTYLI